MTKYLLLNVLLKTLSVSALPAYKPQAEPVPVKVLPVMVLLAAVIMEPGAEVVMTTID